MSANTESPSAMTSTDRIEKQYTFRAPRSRVWRALTNAKEFGSWFRVNLEGDFVAGRRVLGRLTIPSYEGVMLEILVERIEAERYFSYRWHPYAINPAVDYTIEPTTLVEFTLAEADGVTTVNVVESGFDQLPLGRRDEAFRMNNKGWDGQMKNLTQYVG
jgi:uncharacterized protein YndB with AHSA1/START domain